ncbi:MAG: hypothetical protein SGI77_18430 [Pirellulaceae bacterium]|nr:hypothetical protein [Pirellulaceae bacterium]
MFIREYLRVLIPLVVMLAVYRLIAVPLIEPPFKQIEPIAPSAVRDRNAPWWNEYFHDGTWQLNEPMMAETEQGTVLLFGKMETLAPDRIKLSPLTILIPQKDDEETVGAATSIPSKRQAIVFESPSGMEIQFHKPLNRSLGGQVPPVKGGQMIGDIKIVSPPRKGDLNDGLLIESRDLRIDRRRIWTTEAVKMKIGSSYVEGRDLSIYLDQDLLSSKDQGSDSNESAFNGLDRLELIYVDRVHIDLPDNGLFAERTPGAMGVTPPKPAFAEVHCEGAFRFEFHQAIASLSTNVQLRHQVEGMPQDNFLCDGLDLHFVNGNKSKKPTVSGNPSLPDQSDWTIDRIEAYGSNSTNPNDPARWVRLEAPSMQTRGQGRWLKVELDRGRIAFANHLPGVAPDDSSQVYLEREGMQVWSPELEYESQQLKISDPSKAPTTITEEPMSLGKLWAAGPGQAAVLSEDGDQWRLSWAKSLQLQPDGRSDRLTIDGSANARSERQGRFAADSVDIWLNRISENLVNYVASQTNGYQTSSILPERMHAAGHVIVHTPSLRAQVTDMKFWFSYPEIENAQKQLASMAVDPTAQLLRQPSGSSQLTAGSSGQPSGPGQLAASNMELPNLSSKSQRGATASSPSLPLNVTGETLVAKLSQTSQGSQIDDLAIAGSVTITRDQISPTSPFPLTITGSQLRMDSSDEGKMDATIIGSPARFAIGSGAIESNEIRLNERRQMIWIDQPGSFRIPPEAMQSIATTPNNTKPSLSTGSAFEAPGLMPSRDNSKSTIEWIEAPEVQWQGRMVFDGRVARMDGGVKLNARMRTDPETLWRIEGKARELQVELQEPIAIGGETTGNAKVANVRLIDAVDIKAAQTDLQGTRRSLEHLEVPELVLLVPQQQWIGTGPGSLRSRRIGNANPGSPKFITGGKSSDLPSPNVRNPQAELQCLHLRFRGRMEGDMNQQSVSFHDRVETLLQPILSWEQSPDVQLVDRLKLGQTTMMCDVLSMYNTANLSWNQTQIQNQQLRRDAAWEITGVGHVRVESVGERGSFAVLASRAQYVAVHSLLRIEGAPREAAIIETTPSNSQSGEAPGRAEISTGAINLKTGEADLQITRILGNISELTGQPKSSANSSQAANTSSPSFGSPTSSGNSQSIPSPRDAYPLRRQ